MSHGHCGSARFQMDMTASTPTAFDNKKTARREASVRRDEAHRRGAVDAAITLSQLALPLLRDETARGSAVAGYWPMRSEIDPRPLMEALYTERRVLCLPVVMGDNQPLVFRRWQPGDPLERAVFDTLVPRADGEEVVPDIVLAPLLAFDRHRQRLGYGRGYYDLTLNRLRLARTIRAYGMAFAAQEMERVPTDPWDQPLDAILTEKGII